MSELHSQLNLICYLLLLRSVCSTHLAGIMSEAGPSERPKSSQPNTQSRLQINPQISLVVDGRRQVASVGSTNNSKNNHLWICRVCEVQRSSRRGEICAKCRTESVNEYSDRNSVNSQGTPNRRRVIIHQSSPPNVQAPSQTKRPESAHQETLVIDPASSEYESDDNESDFDEMLETIPIPSARRRTTYRSQLKPRSQPKSTSQPNPEIIIDISRNRRNGHCTYYRRSAQTQYSMGKQKVVHHTSDSVTAKKRSKTQTMGSLPTQPMDSRRYHTENSLSQPFGSAVVARNIEPEPEPEPESEPESESESEPESESDPDPDPFFDFNVLPKPAPNARTLQESIGYDYYGQSISDKRTRRSRPTPDDSVPIMPTRIQYVSERSLVVSRNKPSRRSQPISYSPSTMNKYYSTSFGRRPDIYKSGETEITINSSGKRPSGFPSYWGPSYPPETDVATALRKGNSKAPRSKEEPTTSPQQENLQGLEGRDIPYPSRYPLSSSSISPQHVVSGTPNPLRAWLPADEGYYAFSAGEPCILQSSVPLGKPIFDAKPDTELRTMEDNMGTEDKSVDTAKSLGSGISREPLGNVVDESEPAQLIFPSSEPTEDLEDLNQASEDIQAILTKRSRIEESEDEIDHRYQYRSSLSSSYAASIASSVFSKGSLASSATDISRGSGYSVDQIATATKLLLSILHEDLILLPLYKSAVDNPDIGPERLQRNLSRIFKAYSKLLEAEATERLEYLTSKLVLAKSAFLARSIVEKLRSARQNLRIPCSEHLNDSSDEDDDGKFEETPLINEEVFQDLVVFREFLIESEAFRSLRARVQAFVMPKSTNLPKSSGIEEEESFKNDAVQSCLANQAAQPKSYQTWQNWIEDFKNTIDGLFHSPILMETVKNAIFLIADALILATDDLLITIAQLEPPLRPGMIRLRWQCSCGDSLYSDVTELRPGGVSDLIGHMQRISGAKVHASPYNQRTNNQKYIVPRPFQWVRNAFQKVESITRRATQPSTCLPQHNTPCPINASATPNNPAPQQRTLHLLACMHRDRLRKVLQQDPIENVTTDRTLVCFLRKQYIRHRGRILHMLSLKSIKGVLFVKFRLPIGGSVDVRHHDPCCVAASVGAMTCECIPPSTKVEPSPGAEYQCIPGPPATYPPIPPEYLSSLITCPTDVHEKDTWILDQLPKRTCGELQGQIGKPAEGWGIYYQEGWDRDAIALVVLVVFIIASLLFGILWSRFKYDVQGAFGVSAYMIACCAVLIPVLSTRAEKMG